MIKEAERQEDKTRENNREPSNQLLERRTTQTKRREECDN